jgi:hypothetical protein
MIAEIDSGDITLDALTTMHTALHLAERDHIGAWYRAGLAAGGHAVDWVRWYRERLLRWPNPEAAQSHLAALSDASHRAKLESLPDYWR